MTIGQQVFPNFGVALSEKVDLAILTLQTYQPSDPYYGCFSGGKDSCVIKELARLADVNIKWHYNVTTIDPPELMRFIRRYHTDVAWNRPQEHFFKVLVRKGFPLRRSRWCCAEFKERGGVGRVKILGIRAAESPRRKANWRVFTRWQPTPRLSIETIETMELVVEMRRLGFPVNNDDLPYMAASWCVNPILHWSDADVWQFIRERDLPYCQLYDEGLKRIGCIGCPMGGADQVQRDFARWPAYERAWRRAFHRLWERRRDTVISRGKRKGRQWPGFPTITTADELFVWWVSGDKCPDKGDDSCQMGMF